MSSQYPASRKRPANAREPTAPHLAQPKPTKDAKLSVWAFIRFIDENGEFQTIGGLDPGQETNFAVHIILSQASNNANLKIKGSIVNGLQGAQFLGQDFVASFLVHNVANMIHDIGMARLQNLRIFNTQDSSYSEPPPNFLPGRKAKYIEAWTTGPKYLPNVINTLLLTTAPIYQPAPSSVKPGDQICWGQFEALTETVASVAAQSVFANAEQYEIAMKMGVLRENETVVRQTQALLLYPYTLVLVHLHPPRSIPRNPLETNESVSMYKGNVVLDPHMADLASKTVPKLDVGLPIRLAWTNRQNIELGNEVAGKTGLFPPLTGKVIDLDANAPVGADFAVLLRKEKGMACPAAVEPNEKLGKEHGHTVKIMADSNDWSAKRQFNAISQIAQSLSQSCGVIC
ncbi:MAG: hypothetical protein M1829_002444 [Trizodia sp. TS-e1964]|nr:MAG: hypothetical protein M1829_002444 [Trizodia sp. TS-e1964]